MGCGDDPADFEICPEVSLEQCACPEGAPLWHETMGCIAESDCDGMSEDADQDGYPASEECDDDNAGVYPGAVEVCNGIDDNCDGTVDEGCDEDPVDNQEVLCESTGGQMGAIDDCAPFTCDNLPGEAEACLTEAKYGCQCPDSAPLWSDETGCFAASDCGGDEAADPTALCEATGGQMDDCLSGCAPYTCENPPQEVETCLAVCVMGCACPEDAPLWSDEAGCFAVSECEGGEGDGSGSATDGTEAPSVPEAEDADSGGCQGGAEGPWLLMSALLLLGWMTRRRMAFEA